MIFTSKAEALDCTCIPYGPADRLHPKFYNTIVRPAINGKDHCMNCNQLDRQSSAVQITEAVFLQHVSLAYTLLLLRNVYIVASLHTGGQCYERVLLMYSIEQIYKTLYGNFEFHRYHCK